MESLKIILKNKYLNTWAHPSAFLEKNNLELSEINLIRILNSMKKNKVLMEINGKYNVPPLKWIELAAVYDIDFVIGNDIHKLEDFSRNKFNLMEDV
jgi:DNA polymerase (family 10)/putative hydrolase